MNGMIITWDNISKSLACINLSKVISNDIIIITTSKTMIILLFSFGEGKQTVVKHLPAGLAHVNLQVSTYLQTVGL